MEALSPPFANTFWRADPGGGKKVTELSQFIVVFQWPKCEVPSKNRAKKGQRPQKNKKTAFVEIAGWGEAGGRKRNRNIMPNWQKNTRTKIGCVNIPQRGRGRGSGPLFFIVKIYYD